MGDTRIFGYESKRPLSSEELCQRGFYHAADAKRQREIADYYMGETRWMK